MKVKNHIPNAITLLNIFVGVAGIIFVLDGDLLSGAYFVLLAAFFDFLDGFVARLLRVQGELGKQLDSLADVVSFGVLPGVMLFSLAKDNASLSLIPYLTLIIPMLSAYRLAKFNLDTRQSDQFIGLPTPANALLISTLPHLILSYPSMGIWIQNSVVLAALAWILGILLIAEIPLIAMKFQNFKIQGNEFRFILLLTALTLFSLFGLAGVPFIILVYIILSIVSNMTKQK